MLLSARLASKPPEALQFLENQKEEAENLTGKQVSNEELTVDTKDIQQTGFKNTMQDTWLRCKGKGYGKLTCETQGFKVGFWDTRLWHTAGYGTPGCDARLLYRVWHTWLWHTGYGTPGCDARLHKIGL